MMKSSTTNINAARKPSTTGNAASSITAYSNARARQGEIVEDYSAVRFSPSLSSSIVLQG